MPEADFETQGMLSLAVVIPTCDRGAFLQRTVDCVLRQSMVPSEVILVDNGYEEADIQSLDSHIKTIRTPPRIGPGRARNIGARAATSDLIAFLDDDDLWAADYLERVLERFRETAADAVLARLMRHAVGSTPKPYKLMPDDVKAQRRIFWCNPGIGGQNLTIRRDVFLELGGFDEAMPASEDRDLAARLLLAGKRLVSQPAATAILCDHGGGRARHNLVIGNYTFIKKHWRQMHASELCRALWVLAKRRIKP